MRCKICQCNYGNIFKVKELQFGFREDFEYFECSNCGALQIVEIPELSKYYPRSYWVEKRGVNIIKNFLRKRRNEYLVIKKGLVGKFVSKLAYNSTMAVIGETHKINKKFKILDVGCGSCDLLYSLYEIGFKYLYGCDPFYNGQVDPNIKFFRGTIFEIKEGDFDLIMFHHSLEHMDDHYSVLSKAKNLLKKDGTILVRIPLKNDYIMNLYGTNWVQIDAPRHLIIHTMKSFNFLALNCGLKIEKVIFDSNGFQFWGSELYKLGIPLVEGRKRLKDIFGNDKLKEWEKKAKNLNKMNLGDQAAFFLKILE